MSVLSLSHHLEDDPVREALPLTFPEGGSLLEFLVVLLAGGRFVRVA
jgi:hypothetical protein